MKKLVINLVFSSVMFCSVALATDCEQWMTSTTVYNTSSDTLYAYPYSNAHGSPLLASVEIAPGASANVDFGRDDSSFNCNIFISNSAGLSGTSPTTGNYCGTSGIVNQYGSINAADSYITTKAENNCIEQLK